MNPDLSSKLELPCGELLPNRIVKAAMTEGLATPDGRPTPELEQLYRIWAAGGAGVLISGNIIIDKDHLERPGNVIIDSKPDADMAARLKSWAKAGTQAGNHFWAQLSHAGRQTQKVVNPAPNSASDVQLAISGGNFGKPVPLTKDEISDLVERFGIAAKACKDAGFTGVQIHAAHGYLISQFLSPRVNLRDDEYGGSLENRARFLMDIVAAVRTAVGREFPISVKLNSADFQKGGFDFEDSVKVVQWLEAASVDMMEISGGSYEQPTLVGQEGAEAEIRPNVAPSTAAREAYFVDFANAMQAHVTIPLMVVGGFRTRAAMEQALESGAADAIGIARPMCLMTDSPRQLLGGLKELPRYEDNLGLLPDWLDFLRRFQIIKTLDSFAGIYWFYQQIWLLGHTGGVDASLAVFKTFRTVEARNIAIMKARTGK